MIQAEPLFPLLNQEDKGGAACRVSNVQLSPEGEVNNVCQISQNEILHMKFSEFYLCFQNYCEI